MAPFAFSRPVYLSWSELRLVLCTLLFCLAAFAGEAQQKDDHLVPVAGILSGHASRTQYYTTVRETLYAGLGQNPIARLVVLPSFEPEYVLSIEQKNNKYYLIYKQSQNKISVALPAQSNPKGEVNTKSVEVSKQVATAVGQLFSTAIERVRYPEPVVRIRSDGTTFTFISFQEGMGVRAGETWSPGVKTKMATLVAVAKRLQELVAAFPNQQLEQDLLQQAEQLPGELQAEK